MPTDTSDSHYWAFISYSRQDEVWARRIAARLERFRVPADLRESNSIGPRRMDRLSPVFRDREELSAASDLAGKLDEALLTSEYLLVVCSPAAAQSKWVNLEIQYFVEHRGADRVLLLVVDGEPKSSTAPDREAFPPAILALPREPLWIDVRPGGDTKGHALIRIAAGMLGVGFDTLWRRERRRKMWLLAGWAASVAVLLAALVLILTHQQKTANAVFEQEQEKAAAALAEQRADAERRTPQAQIAAFEKYLRDLLKSQIDHATDNDVKYTILVSEDLNGDSLLDFIVLNESTGFCGSGGCDTTVYIANANGSYVGSGELFGNTSPRALPQKTGNVRDIAGVEYTIGGQSLWNIFQWTGKQYEIVYFKFCGVVALEYCSDPDAIIDPIPEAELDNYKIKSGARYYTSPIRGSILTGQHSSPNVEGKVRDNDWYLVEIGKNTAAFVEGKNISKVRRP